MLNINMATKAIINIMSIQSTYSTLASTLRADELSVTPAEMHGLLTGMICGGLNPQSHDWMPMLYDYTNDGLGWPMQSQEMAATYLEKTVKELNAKKIRFSLLLPPENTDLIEQANALTEWVNAFIAGIGLIGISSNQLSEESNEILKELTEIALLHIDEDEDLEELTPLFQQVVEHVLDCVLTLHFYLSAPANDSTDEENKTKPTLH